MDWKSILNLYTWTPLRNIVLQGDQVLPGVYPIGTNAYIWTIECNQTFENNLPDAPFITLAYWAPNVESLKRCIHGDPKIRVAKHNQHPPEELLLGTNGKYGELENKIPSELGVYTSAAYSSTGIFLYQNIKIGRFEFLFFENKIKKEDMVCAIKISLL